ncbi:LuxR family transcriptional regulator [Microlunatus endophyticus]|uniref:LuxR family transcriptional regulator n=1 Tax=Microlunatus endophyticus TaxID=1716077 RepID=A0A917SHC1_9ACTN|nr:helix-turn-helix transcriptional regulator [Microlunatus endophyticus]GGL77883.1 LuxR family transcriptional regulator [Microlunatus endophyticus]
MPTELLSARSPTASTLVGRTAELERLTRALDLTGPGSAAGPSGALRHVLVAGDAGIGKTRLLTELGRLVGSSDRRLAIGHCLDFGDATLPYLPFTEIFGRLQAEAASEMSAIAHRHRAIRRLLPSERALPDDPDEPAEPTGHVGRTELFDAVARAFDRLAADGGLVVMIEDLHWSDPSSRDLLTYLLARRFEHPVCLVMSYRTDDLVRSHPLRAVLANWSRLDQLERIDLPRLSDGELQQMVLGLRPELQDGELDSVVRRADGNAFFAEELAAAADVRGTVPSDLAGLLLVRLDALTETAVQVVRVAAVAGRQVGHELLAAVAELPTDELDQAIRSAVEGQVLVGRSDGYAFRHALLAEAVYDDLLPGERVRFHARYVQALSRPGIGGTAAERARHARSAHDIATTIRASIEAGDEALRVGGPDDALRHYRNALRLAETNPIPGVDDQAAALVSLTIKAADAAETAGHLDQSIDLLRDRLSDGPAVAGAVRAALLQALAASLLYSDYDLDERTLLTEALDLVDPERDRELYCKILATRARSFMSRGRYSDAIEASRRATALARELGLHRTVAHQTILLARIKQRLGDPESSIQETERVLANAVADGDAGTEVRATDQLGTIRFEQGRLADALAAFERGAERATTIGRRWSPHGLDSAVMAAQTAFALGEWDRSLELSAGDEQVPDLSRANLDLGILAVRAGRGDPSGFALLPRLRRWWPYDAMTIINSVPAVELYAFTGGFDAALGLYDELVAATERAYGGTFIGQLRMSGVLLDVLTMAARASRDIAPLAARAEDAVAAATTAMDSFLTMRTPGPEAYAWLARVRAEELRFRSATGQAVEYADQVAAWRAAVQGFTEYPHLLESTRSRIRLAAVLRDGDHDDRQEAAELIADAAQVAARLGARPLEAELATLGVRGAAAPRPSDRNPLTAREREVLDLVAEGLSNREIGCRLVISTKTASVHVSNIMAKLGADSRTEAVAIARRQGLLG